MTPKTNRTIAVAAVAALVALHGCGGDDAPVVDASMTADLGHEIDIGIDDDFGIAPDDFGIDEDLGVEQDLGASPVDLGAHDLGTDAGPPVPEACPTEGAMRLGPCGNCGMQQDTCTSGVWAGTSACLGSRACAPASIETEPTAMCGERTRLCALDCEWGLWEQTAPDGECLEGATRVVSDTCGPGTTRIDACAASCSWTPGPCAGACGGTRRTTPADAEEICIPPGDFIRGGPPCPTGGTGNICPTPAVTVTLTRPYYFDRYAVTNRRYQECIDARVCWAIVDLFGDLSLEDPTRSNYPVQSLTVAQARAFCEWDGDRRMPTSAEWEKAARGPAPRDDYYVWGGYTFRCDLMASEAECGSTVTSDYLIAPHSVDAFPAVRSYYGVDGMMGIGGERVSDPYRASYHTDPSSRVDPPGSLSGTRQLRGHALNGELDGSSARVYAFKAVNSPPLLRCVRTAPPP